MNWRVVLASLFAASVCTGGALADPAAATDAANSGPGPQSPVSQQDHGGSPSLGDAILRLSADARTMAKTAAASAVVAPPPAAPPPETAPVAQLDPPPAPSIQPELSSSNRPKTTAAKTKIAAAPPRPVTLPSRAAPNEPREMRVRVVGSSETGTAAWYGGRYVGRRTTSGERLDTTHATAAHRTLPLNSLARVTNLRNGRSVIVRVTDRGPVSPSLLIDMSPQAAEELAMKQAGLVPVKVEQVVALPPDPK